MRKKFFNNANNKVIKINIHLEDRDQIEDLLDDIKTFLEVETNLLHAKN